MSELARYAVTPAFSWRPDSETDFTFLSNFQSGPYVDYYGWLPREGMPVPYYDTSDNPHKLPTGFDEGEDDNRTACRQKMVGYNFLHALDGTFTVYQNLQYDRVKTLYCSVHGYGHVAPGKINRQCVRSDEGLSVFTADTQLQSAFAIDDVEHTLLIGAGYSHVHNDVNALYGSVDPLNMNNP